VTQTPEPEPDALANDRARLVLDAGVVTAGRYRLERRLGEGGMGVVWAARHVVTRKAVALKFLKDTARENAAIRHRFLREARAACAVRHPNVVEVHDVFELTDGSPVIVMDLLEGETLAGRLARVRALSLAEVARIMVPVCAAVGSAHALGIVHRDLKPDNIFLAVESDGTTVVKVLDFGIAKLTATEGDAASTGAATGTGVVLGTPFYMAPEQMFGERTIDHRADLWALGVILYEALTGQRPTQGSNLGQVLKIVAKDGIVSLREVAPSLPEPVLHLVSRLLESDRAKRPADLREVVAVLSSYTDLVSPAFGAPQPARESGNFTPVRGLSSGRDGACTPATPAASNSDSPWGRRRSLAIAVGAVTFGVVGAAAMAARWSGGHRQDRLGVRASAMDPDLPSARAATESSAALSSVLEEPLPPLATSPSAPVEARSAGASRAIVVAAPTRGRPLVDAAAPAAPASSATDSRLPGGVIERVPF
jgi:serine/threonine protein kinase